MAELQRTRGASSLWSPASRARLVTEQHVAVRRRPHGSGGASRSRLRTLSLFAEAAVASLLLVACGSDSDAKGPGTCEDWRQAICERNSRCESRDFDQCMLDFANVQCATDTISRECLSTIEGACSTELGACGVDAIADVASARTVCQEITAATCDWEQRCGLSTPAECTTRIEQVTGVDCELAVGLAAGAEQCAAAMDAAACGALPAVCSSPVTVRVP